MTCVWRRGELASDSAGKPRCGRPATRNLLGVAPPDGKDNNPTCDECATRLKKMYGFESEESTGSRT